LRAGAKAINRTRWRGVAAWRLLRLWRKLKAEDRGNQRSLERGVPDLTSLETTYRRMMKRGVKNFRT
jgi:hypothetical protein